MHCVKQPASLYVSRALRPLITCTIVQVDAGWSSPVARQAHNLKVTGSNPVPATKSSLIALMSEMLFALQPSVARRPANHNLKVTGSNPVPQPNLIF